MNHYTKMRAQLVQRAGVARIGKPDCEMSGMAMPLNDQCELPVQVGQAFKWNGAQVVRFISESILQSFGGSI